MHCQAACHASPTDGARPALLKPVNDLCMWCLCTQAKLAQEAMQALELGADGGLRQALHQAPDIILPPSSATHFLA